MGIFQRLVVGSETRARVVPYLLFAALTLLQGSLGPSSPYWIYLGKTLLGVLLILWMWPVVREMRWAWSWEAIGVGVLVFFIWVGADPHYLQAHELARTLGPWADRLGLGALFQAETGKAWNPHVAFGEDSVLAWGFLSVRLLGSTLVVPPLEEVFFRSFLYRYLARHRFLDMSLAEVRWIPFVTVAVIFGVGHHQWLAGILCGLAYQWLTCRRGRLGEAMTAHAVTNFLLAIWVIGRGQWQFW